MPRLALSGGAYQARSVIASAQRCLNLLAEPLPQQQGEPAQFAFYPTPGLRLLGTLPKGPVRGIKQVTAGGVYAVGGDTVYHVNPDDWTSTALGTITPMRPYPVSMQDNGNTLMIVDGTTSGWTVDLASNAFAAISDPAFYGADRVDYLDTYFVLNKPRTPQFYISGSLAVTWDSLDFANKESFSDLLVTVAVAKREIWLLGDRTTEVWYNAGVSSISDFTFAQIQGTFVDQGCAAKYSAAVYDDAVYWLGGNRAGQGIVLKGAGYQNSRISTYAIENELATYPRIDDAIGFTYLLAGHPFYVLTFPTADKTWVYDIATQQWHEWLWIDNDGEEHRHRLNCAYAINGMVVGGDHQNGNLYAVETTALTDNGRPIKRQRSYPHIINQMDRVYYRQFVADIESGNPLGPATSVTTITKVVTWLPEIAQFIGPTTTTTTLVVPDWQRGVVYFTDFSSYSSWSAQLTTQSSPIASATADGLYPQIMAVDPMSGDLLVQRGTTNGEPVQKLDPSSFAVIGTFGIATSTPSYPTAVWVGQSIVCVVCNGVSFGFIKQSQFSGNVSAFRVDTMQHAGFQQAVVSGSTNNRGTMCAGKSGGSAASVFVSWDSTTAPAPSIPLYVINVTAGAETYNPASWPTTNSHITWATVGTIAASAIDPTWSHVAIHSLGYDLADSNVLMWVLTSDAVAQRYYVIKVNATNATVMWVVPVSATTQMKLETSRINGSLWVFDGSSSRRIDTLAGQVVQQMFQGTFNNVPGYPMTDSEQALALFFGNYTSGTNSPIAVTGTSTFTGGWGLMGGQTEVSTTTTSAVTGSQIFLEWSDDRGHSYGSPVGQPLGNTGEYLTSVQWQRCGYARDRVWRLTWSIPVATALQGAFIEVDTSPKS